MNDSRDYVSHSVELGNIHISEEVLCTIAAAAALEVEGVASLAAQKDPGDRIGKKNLSKSVRIRMDDDDRVLVEVVLLIRNGHTIPEIGHAVQEGVRTAIESMTGLKVACVHVNVAGIIFPEQKQAKA